MLQSCIIYDGSPTALTYRAEKVRSEDVLRVAKKEACLTHRGIAYHHDLQESIKRFHDADLAKQAIVSSRSQTRYRFVSFPGCSADRSTTKRAPTSVLFPSTSGPFSLPVLLNYNVVSCDCC